ncbi:MAG: RecB family exonuclease [Acidimicrobiales bacterium]
MSLPLPTSLSPSKVSSFRDCALSFRLSAIDRVPEAPSAAAAKGTLVHRALELLLCEEEPGDRHLPVALAKLARAAGEVLDGPEYAGLGLAGAERDAFLADAAGLVRHYFDLEDPNSVRVIGTELRVAVSLGSFTLRGVIDRLELDGAGQLVVTDYKTGRAPPEAREQTRLVGVHLYSLLCERLFGRRPARIQLLHLREPLSIVAVPTDQSVRATVGQTEAVWAAVQLACQREDFRPRPGPPCQWCGYRAYCPAAGGDLALVPTGGAPAGGDLAPAPTGGAPAGSGRSGPGPAAA